MRRLKPNAWTTCVRYASSNEPTPHPRANPYAFVVSDTGASIHPRPRCCAHPERSIHPNSILAALAH
jgi:hypothetical protein